MTSTAVPPRPAAVAAAEEPQWLPHRQVLTILSGLILGMFLAALDQSIVSVAIVKIANDLHGFDQQAWATTAYLITATITTPLYGKLADIYGRKPFYLTAISLFVIGSFACTFAGSMYQLAAFRAFQGLGAGGLMSLALTIVGDIVPPRERVRYQGYFMMVFGSATVLGPVLGGFFSGYDTLLGLGGWRWVFLVNVPIGLVALAVVGKVLNVPHKRHDHRIDWFGAVSLAIAVVPLLIVAEQGRAWGWGSTSAVVCYGIAAVGLVLFLFVEYVMKEEALIPLRLFSNSAFSVAIAGSAIVGVAMFGAMSMVPQYFQVVRGFSPTKAGLLMLTLMAGLMVSSQLSGRLTKATGRYKVLPVAGTFVIALGAALYAQVDFDSPLWQPLIYNVIIGFGLGACMQTLVMAAQNAGPRSDMGVSTATVTFFRQLGGTLGVAVFLTILFNVLPDKIIDAFGGNLPKNFDGGKLDQIQSNTSGMASLPDTVKEPILIGFTNSMHVVFYAAAGVSLLACLVLLFLKEIPLLDGSKPAASAVKPESRLPVDVAQADTVALAGTTFEREPEQELVSVGAGRHSTAETNGHTNGHDATQSAGQVVPVLNSVTGFDGTGPDTRNPIGGQVRRSDGAQVSGAALTLIDQRGRQAARSISDGNGNYRIGAPGSGTYVLIVSANGHQPQAASVVVDHDPIQLDLTLAGSGLLGGVVRVAGSREGIAGATVTLTDVRGEVVGAESTDERGDYTFHGIGAGNYTLVVAAERMRPTATLLTVPDSGVLTKDVDLSPTVVLSGLVRNAEDRPVPDALIVVQDNNGAVVAGTRSAEDGHYVVADLAEGDYTVVASGYPPAAVRVTLTAGVEVAHNVQLGYDEGA